jgi:hypothetical protein
MICPHVLLIFPPQMLSQVEELRRQFDLRESETKRAFLQDLQAVRVLVSSACAPLLPEVMLDGCTPACRREKQLPRGRWQTPKRCMSNSSVAWRMPSPLQRTRYTVAVILSCYCWCLPSLLLLLLLPTRVPQSSLLITAHLRVMSWVFFLLIALLGTGTAAEA